MWYYIIVVLTAFVTAEESNGPIVTINSGKIEGRIVENIITNSTYYAFQGIPYAKPPIGNLRFQAPVPVDPWRSTLKTKKDANICKQDFLGNENCLFLNVFTNQLPTKPIKLCPVIFWIHGGAYYRGSQNTSLYGPEYLLKKNVVVVSINYRLNVFGFVNSLDDAAPGNAGLKDQRLALKWVRDNIVKFNGDPKRVTIFGQSAGGVCVQYHLQSKLSAGLFHRAISLSGSTLNQRSIQFNPKEKLFRLKNVLDIASNDTKEIIKKLQQLDANDVYNASTMYSARGKENLMEALPFVPSVEHKHPDAIIAEPSIDVLIKGNVNKVPYVVSYVTGESLLFLSAINSGQLVISDFNEDKSLLVSPMLYLRNDRDKKIVQNKILKQYFQNSSVEDLDKFLNFQSYNLFINGIRQSVELLCENVSTYLYKFSYKGSINPGMLVKHAEDLNYIFFRSFVNLTATDKLIVDHLTTMLTNFAKTGNPNSNDSSVKSLHWDPFTENLKSYLEIGNETTTSNNPDNEDSVFWRNIYKKYSKYGSITSYIINKFNDLVFGNWQ